MSEHSVLEQWAITYGHLLLRLLTGASRVYIVEQERIANAVSTPLEALQRKCEQVLLFPRPNLTNDEADQFGWSVGPELNAIERQGFTVFAELVLPLVTSGAVSKPEVRLFVQPSQEPEPFKLPTKLARPDIRDPEHFVWWDSIVEREIAPLQGALDSGAGERTLHRIVELHPILLVQSMNAGHGRWVYSRQRLSLQHEIDFLIAEQDSMGFTWTAVELEDLEDPFSAKGEPRARLNHAIDQIRSWRIWLDNHRVHAQAPKSESGLGLRQINSRCQGVVYIGRRHHFTDRINEWRRHLKAESQISVRSYDGLVTDALNRIPYAKSQGSQS